MGVVLKSQSALDEVRNIVVTEWKEMREERQVLEETWKRCLMAFLCTFDKDWEKYAKQAGRSHRYVGLTWDAVHTLAPQLVNAAMGIDDWLTVLPHRPGFDQNDDMWAEAMKYMLEYQMRQGKFEKTAKIAAKSLVMLGNCPWSVDWITRRAVDYGSFTAAMEEWVGKTAEYHAEHKQVMEQYKDIAFQAKAMGSEPPPPPQFVEPPRPPKDLDIIYQGPILRIGSIFNYVQEQHPNDEFSSARIMRSWRTKAYLKKLAKAHPLTGYKLYDNIEAITEINSEETAPDNEAEALFKMAVGMQLPHGKNKNEIKERHGTFELNGAGGEKGVYENYIVTVANDQQVIRCEPNPMFSGRPLVQNARLNIIEGAVYGIGPIEKALDEQDSANAVHNQSIDAVNAVIQPEYEVLEDNLVDGRMKPSGPGVKHYVNEMGAIRAIEKNFQGIPMGFAALEAIVARHERITGAINTAPQGDESATKTARNTNVIAGKNGSHVEDFEAELITEALDTFLELNAQYIDTNQLFNVLQDKKIIEVDIPPQAIRQGWLVYAGGSKYLADREQEIQELLMALQISEQRLAQGIPSPIRDDKLYAKLMKKILGASDDIIKPEAEYQQELQAYRAQQAQQAQLAQMETMANVQNSAGTGSNEGNQGSGSPGAAA